MKDLNGYKLHYVYDELDEFSVTFGPGTATWLCLTGDHAGDTRVETADYTEIADGIFFVSWLEPTQEVISFVANTNTKKIVCSYVGDGERMWSNGKILGFEKVV